jgi:two-component system, response regulator PdtaR
MDEEQKSVLIVEDEVFVAMSLSLDLANAGYRVSTTEATGEGAVEYLQHNRVDGVLMDIGLAGEMDGIEAARHIRSFSTVPIVFMTGYASRATDPAVAAVSPLGFLTKPVSFGRLEDLLRGI